MKYTLFGLIISLFIIQDLNAFQVYNGQVEFTHEAGLEVFLTKTWKAGKNQPWDVNHINSAIVILELDQKGEIIKQSVTEDSNAKGFSEGIRYATMQTKGYWKLLEPLKRDESILIVIPMIQRKMSSWVEQDKRRSYDDLFKARYKELHDLSIDEIPECAGRSCIMVKPIKNFYGDPVH